MKNLRLPKRIFKVSIALLTCHRIAPAICMIMLLHSCSFFKKEKAIEVDTEVPDEIIEEACLYPLQDFRYTSTYNTLPLTNDVRFAIIPPVKKRRIISNSIPDHYVGEFFNDDNPFNLSEKTDTFYMDVNPRRKILADMVRTTSILEQTKTSTFEKNEPKYVFGIALNGVLFDPAAAEPWKKKDETLRNWEWVYEALVTRLGMDESNAHLNIVDVPPSKAHPHPRGQYHYHGKPTKYIEGLNIKGKKMIHIGFAADGFPIYYKYGYPEGVTEPSTAKIKELKSSWTLKEGLRGGDGIHAPCGKPNGKFLQDYKYVRGKGDLDRCNGRIGWTPEFGVTYYYVITEDFPVIPRCFVGEPDESFLIPKLGPPKS